MRKPWDNLRLEGATEACNSLGTATAYLSHPFEAILVRWNCKAWFEDAAKKMSGLNLYKPVMNLAYIYTGVCRNCDN